MLFFITYVNSDSAQGANFFTHFSFSVIDAESIGHSPNYFVQRRRGEKETRQVCLFPQFLNELAGAEDSLVEGLKIL